MARGGTLEFVARVPAGQDGGEGASRASPGRITSNELVQELLATFASPQYTPPLLPAIAMEVLEMSRRPNVDLRKLARLVEKDSFIAGRVVRLAQSPFYAGRAQITSLQDAVVRLGLESLNQMVFQVAANMKVFRAKGYEAPMEELRRHSVATAYITTAVCQRASLSTEFAFLCGLFHDVGMAAALIAITEHAKGPQPPNFAAIWPAVQTCHERASQSLAALWKLPPEVRVVVGNHHYFHVGQYLHPVAAAVCLADWIASGAAAGMQSHVDPAIAAKAQGALGIGDDVLSVLAEEAAVIVKQIQ